MASSRIELRQLFEADDFSPALLPEVREAEERMRADRREAVVAAAF
jgi:hypothetical protein